MQPLVSSLSAGDCPVHRLRKKISMFKNSRLLFFNIVQMVSHEPLTAGACVHSQACLCSVTGLSMWDLCSAECHSVMFFSEYIGHPLSVSSSSAPYSYLIFLPLTLCNLSTYIVSKWNTSLVPWVVLLSRSRIAICLFVDNQTDVVRFEGLTSGLLKTQDYWGVKLCGLVNSGWHWFEVPVTVYQLTEHNIV
jgi:hypothetical protein